MCGLYTDPNSYYETIEELSTTRFVPDLSEIQLQLRYNITPTSNAPMTFEQDGDRNLDLFYWTFVKREK